jgi:uncharacterized OB-fold protein
MEPRSITPDLSSVEIPWDAWSKPFWDAAAERRLLMPRCADCGAFRWPAGPFCPKCQSQRVEWTPPGQGRVYSFTILPVRAEGEDAPPQFRIPALIEFDDAKGVRLVASVVDSPVHAVAIGAAVEVEWIAAANALVPVFRTRAAAGEA